MANQFECEFRRARPSGRRRVPLPIDRDPEFYLQRAHELRAQAYATGIRYAARWLASLARRMAARLRRSAAAPPCRCPHYGIS